MRVRRVEDYVMFEQDQVAAKKSHEEIFVNWQTSGASSAVSRQVCVDGMMHVGVE